MTKDHYYSLTFAWATQAREMEEYTAPWLVEKRIILLARVELALRYVNRLFPNLSSAQELTCKSKI